MGGFRGAGGAPPQWAGSGALGVGEEGALQAEVPKHQTATPSHSKKAADIRKATQQFIWGP